jgi:hypothetical protein
MKEFQYKKICEKCGKFFNVGSENTCLDCLKYENTKDTQHNTTKEDNIIYNPIKDDNFKSIIEKKPKKDYIKFEKELLELISWAKYCKISKARMDVLDALFFFLNKAIGIVKMKQILLNSKDDCRDFYPVEVLKEFCIKKPKKINKISESKVNLVNEDTLYNYMVNNDNSGKIKDNVRHSINGEVVDTKPIKRFIK